MKNILCIPDARSLMGGPASFQRRLVNELERRGISSNFDGNGFIKPDALLLINASRQIGNLIRLKLQRIKIIQRLGSPFPSGSNLPASMTHQVRTWVGTQNMALIRHYLTDHIVYQSKFVKECWEKQYGRVNKPSSIIYNGVDLNLFKPEGPRYESASKICIISVEGGQIYPAQTPAFLIAQALHKLGCDVELLIFGKPWKNSAIQYSSFPFVNFKGAISNAELPYYYRGATLYVLNDIVSAGCPNSVLEALACGAPVVGHSPGVLSEMLSPEAGVCIPAVGNPWKGEEPGNIEALADAAMGVVKNNSAYREGARRLAEARYDLRYMVDQYVKVLFQ